ncbi:biliverdin-producing heme oxygenase [Noviherbaspirillum sp. CPCC 100848]|uniref:Biliverdin-producing heme oxygenase n=1 Tax=Noviherbaspirillum album TaxID=3080276 RepID=A0ABU6J2T2_9BURK|nr:biliverdin-producing heme oxygenase [Noviherbaspirillum sp. CPCC 100848]MEC4717946.1 biliverdin-producing heme oxygenase [Noviherbaspirillum sp. CPCC 100848]
MINKLIAIEALRAATRDAHERLEHDLQVARPDASRDDYLHYLQDLRGWMLPFDAALWSAAWPAAMEAQARAGKLDWIDCDLRAAGMSQDAIHALPEAGFTPDLATLPARFGIAYVIEGAQLGTKVLAKALAPKLAPWSPRWLAGYGESNAKKWRTFVECLESSLASMEAQRVAAMAAADAFASLADWFAQRRQARLEGVPGAAVAVQSQAMA